MIYQIVVPYKVGNGEQSPDDMAAVEKVQTYVARKLAKRFGGYTRTSATGGWINANGELIEECVAVFSSAEAGIVKGRLEWLGKLALEVKEALKQDCVMYGNGPWSLWFTPQAAPKAAE